MREKSIEAVCTGLMVARTDEVLDTEERPICCTKWDDTTHMICINNWQPPDESLMWRLSRDAEATFVYVNENVMYSSAEHWIDGKKTWLVAHDTSVSLDHLEVRGELPAEFQQIRETLTKRQADAEGTDYMFDIPVELFESIFGIRYGQETGKQWQTLEPL